MQYVGFFVSLCRSKTGSWQVAIPSSNTEHARWPCQRPSGEQSDGWRRVDRPQRPRVNKGGPLMFPRLFDFAWALTVFGFGKHFSANFHLFSHCGDIYWVKRNLPTIVSVFSVLSSPSSNALVGPCGTYPFFFNDIQTRGQLPLYLNLLHPSLGSTGLWSHTTEGARVSI